MLRRIQVAVRGASRGRCYHDESFGYRKPREYVFPDCSSLSSCVFLQYSNLPFFPPTDTQTQLDNRAANASLLRYVDSMRTHGHRAARIDPLDLIQREEVAALFPGRYGLKEEEARYNVNGILWTKGVGEQGDEAKWWTLGEIRRHLREVYVGRIGYEVRASFFVSPRLRVDEGALSICTPLPRRRGSGFPICWSRSPCRRLKTCP
jgi:probable 2-oxoglutarate dehydrogenase E1 component DHKTD1